LYKDEEEEEEEKEEEKEIKAKLEEKRANLLNSSEMIPEPPRKPPGAFFLYQADNFDRVRKENPDAKVTDITGILAKDWGNVDAETMAAYQAKNQEAKQRYEQELKEYKQKMKEYTEKYESNVKA